MRLTRNTALVLCALLVGVCLGSTWFAYLSYEDEPRTPTFQTGSDFGPEIYEVVAEDCMVFRTGEDPEFWTVCWE
jgi:hypothetical protein